MRRRKKQISFKILPVMESFQHVFVNIYLYIFFQITLPRVTEPKVCIRPQRSEAHLCCSRSIISEVWIFRAMLNSHIPVIPMGNQICCLWVGISSIFSLGKVDWGYIFSFYQVKWEKKSWLFLIQWRSHLHYKTIIII